MFHVAIEFGQHDKKIALLTLLLKGGEKYYTVQNSFQTLQNFLKENLDSEECKKYVISYIKPNMTQVKF